MFCSILKDKSSDKVWYLKNNDLSKLLFNEVK